MESSSISVTSLQTEEAPWWLKDLLDEAEEAPNLITKTLCRSSSDSIAYFHTSSHHQNQSTSSSNYLSQMIQNKSLQHPQQYCFHPSPSSTTTHPSKRAKRHYAQQSRAMKLEYIAEVERNIQALQVEGFEILAESEFLKQQNRILGMQNTALKQRLDTLSQEKFIKCLEQEMLEKEITRLRNLYLQQQQHQQKHYAIARPRSK